MISLIGTPTGPRPRAGSGRGAGGSRSIHCLPGFHAAGSCTRWQPISIGHLVAECVSAPGAPPPPPPYIPPFE